jgi:hypothetical protein
MDDNQVLQLLYHVCRIDNKLAKSFFTAEQVDKINTASVIVRHCLPLIGKPF